MVKIWSRVYSHVGKRSIFFSDNMNISCENVTEPTFPAFNTTPIINRLIFSGPLGKLSHPIHFGFVINIQKGKISNENNLILSIDDNANLTFTRYQKKFILSMWGTSNAIIRNIIKGVCEGHHIPIRLVGVGYKFWLEGHSLLMKVGHSHFDEEKIPEEIVVKLLSSTKIVCSSVDLHKLSQFAAKVRSHKRPEPYNGKGIFVGEETIIMKEGKKSGK